MSLSGSARPVLEPGLAGQNVGLSQGGRTVLRYSRLSVLDAGGRLLHSWLALDQSRLLLRVDARGVEYPLRVDPFIERGTFGTAEPPPYEAGTSVALSADGTVALIGGYVGTYNVDQKGQAWVFERAPGPPRGAKRQSSRAARKWTASSATNTRRASRSPPMGAPRSSVRPAPSKWAIPTTIAGREAYVYRRGPTGWLSRRRRSRLHPERSRSGPQWLRSGPAWRSPGTVRPRWWGHRGIRPTRSTFITAARWKVSCSPLSLQHRNGQVGRGRELAPKEAAAPRNELYFGASVALSYNGNAALVGRYTLNEEKGDAWFFARGAGGYTEQQEVSAANRLRRSVRLPRRAGRQRHARDHQRRQQGSRRHREGNPPSTSRQRHGDVGT